VRTLRVRGVRDPRILAAVAGVDRAAFVDPEAAERAGEDEPLPLAEGQTTSQPLVIAAMAAALDLHPTDRVLEVGGGSGYAAAVLGRLAGEVHSIEIRPALAQRARRNLDRAGAANVHLHEGDGTAGWPEAAPYDAISVAAGAPVVPSALLAQLARGGRLVMPIGPRAAAQRLVLVRRTTDDRLVAEDLRMPVRFVPLVVTPEEG
jgi:protein-L-isoaspartate(D-aspartate) O-methyltransferase